MKQLSVVARNPHPIGSVEHSRVGDYLLQQLRLSGLEPQVQGSTGFFLEPWWGPPYQVGAVENIVARIKGSANTKAVMLVSHYDSVATGPGAGDDGAGVAAILETVRALRSGPALRNDVIILITDGEEIELLGAAAFVDDHPWARDVGLVLNFEAQGASGPSLMYETSAGNGRLINEFAQAAPYPVSSSMMSEIAKRFTSSDSDLSVFRRAGLSGLNFAFIGDQPRYHTVRDDMYRLDPRSLQHHGSYALALTRHFGNIDLREIRGEDAIYFNVFRILLHYPQRWVWPLNIVALALLAGALVSGFKMRRLRVNGILLSAAIWLIGAGAGIGLAQLVWMLFGATHMIASLPYGDSYNGELYGVGLVALVLAVIFSAYALARAKFTADELVAGALLCWALLTVAASLMVPGGSYLLVWPLLFAAAGLLASFFGRSSAMRWAAWVIPTIVALTVFVPAVYLTLLLLSDNPLMVTVPAAAITAVLVPVILLLQIRFRWIVVGLLVVCGVFMLAGAANRHFDAAHPKADTLFYLANFDNGKAAWASCGTALDTYTSQALTGGLRKSLADYGPLRANCFVQDVPLPALLPPTVSVQADQVNGTSRELTLLVTSARKAKTVWIKLRDVKVQAASINGKKLSPADAFPNSKDWNLIYWNAPDRGLTLSLRLPPGPVNISVFDVSDDLPPLPGSAPLSPERMILCPRPPSGSITLPLRKKVFVGENSMRLRNSETGLRVMASSIPWFGLCILSSAAGFAADSSAKDLIDHGHFKRARTMLEDRLAKNHALVLMARVRLAYRQPGEATTILEQAISLEPNNSDAHLYLGDAYSRKADKAGWFEKIGLARRIKAELQQAITLDPRSSMRSKA